MKGERAGGRPSEYLEGTPQRIRCLVEMGVKASHIFKLVHDGAERGSRYYIKDYQLFLTSIEHPEGELCDGHLIFKYDLRDNWAEVSISRHGIAELDRAWSNLIMEEDQCQQEVSGQQSDSIA